MFSSNFAIASFRKTMFPHLCAPHDYSHVHLIPVAAGPSPTNPSHTFSSIIPVMSAWSGCFLQPGQEQQLAALACHGPMLAQRPRYGVFSAVVGLTTQRGELPWVRQVLMVQVVERAKALTKRISSPCSTARPPPSLPMRFETRSTALRH